MQLPGVKKTAKVGLLQSAQAGMDRHVSTEEIASQSPSATFFYLRYQHQHHDSLRLRRLL